MAEQVPEPGKLTDHDYDGIREYDNPCPTWWHLIFLGTFVFSALYFLFFLGSFGWTVAEAYDTAVAENLKLRFAEIGELSADQPTLVKYLRQPDWLAIGASVYQAQCKSCHGADGAGLVGPNLTDNNYKNVKLLVDVARVVENGASAGAMPAWKSRLHPNELVLVSAYVASLRGKALAGPGDAVEQRDGQYREIPPWPAAPADETDSSPDPPADKTPQADKPDPSAEKTPPPAGESPT
ncbi:MAG: cbb3-type cytochrome c oxidase N-terminal domain-containing protein [Thermoguttaceae bacterium]